MNGDSKYPSNLKFLHIFHIPIIIIFFKKNLRLKFNRYNFN